MRMNERKNDKKEGNYKELLLLHTSDSSYDFSKEPL